LKKVFKITPLVKGEIVFYAMLEWSINCPKCDGPVMLNGPLETAHCNRCQTDITIPHDYWKSILDDVMQEVKSDLEEGEGTNSNIFGTFKTALLYAQLHPQCEKCKTDIEVNENLETGYTHTCKICGNTVKVSPSPYWLQEVCPPIKLLFNAELESGKGDETPAISGPIVFSCPKCGGALTVDGSERLVPCEFCGVSVYLPDDLWLRLHPAKIKSRWYIGFE
jgi:hypothetical protein